MLRQKRVNAKIKYLLLGALAAITVLFLMGATTEKQPVLENGRYQISAWGNANRFGAFVLDTVTGKTKIVYHYNELAEGKFQEINNLNKPFSKME